ncbi:MAG: response regulator [Candidatus Dormibacteria bacterium]
MSATLPAHIVLAEDEPMIGRILEFKLDREGHRVTWVRTAAEAERICLAEQVDLLLCDVTLEEDGRVLCRRLVDSSRQPRSGVVLMPEQRSPDGERLALEAGARAVVIKPFKPTIVAAKIRELLDSAD